MLELPAKLYVSYGFYILIPFSKVLPDVSIYLVTVYCACLCTDKLV